MLKKFFLQRTETIGQLVRPIDPIDQVIELPNRTFLSPDLILGSARTRFSINFYFKSLSFIPK
jgi:hypothetical protein